MDEWMKVEKITLKNWKTPKHDHDDLSQPKHKSHPVLYNY